MQPWRSLAPLASADHAALRGSHSHLQGLEGDYQHFLHQTARSWCENIIFAVAILCDEKFSCSLTPVKISQLKICQSCRMISNISSSSSCVSTLLPEDQSLDYSLPTFKVVKMSMAPQSSSLAIDRLFALQLFEQHVISSQLLSHFFLQVNGRPQTTQIFSGRFDLVGFFSFLSPPPPLRPNNRVAPPLGVDSGSSGGTNNFDRLRRADVLAAGAMKVDEQPMAPMDAKHNEKNSLLQMSIPPGVEATRSTDNIHTIRAEPIISDYLLLRIRVSRYLINTR